MHIIFLLCLESGKLLANESGVRFGVFFSTLFNSSCWIIQSILSVLSGLNQWKSTVRTTNVVCTVECMNVNHLAQLSALLVMYTYWIKFSLSLHTTECLMSMTSSYTTLHLHVISQRISSRPCDLFAFQFMLMIPASELRKFALASGHHCITCHNLKWECFNATNKVNGNECAPEAKHCEPANLLITITWNWHWQCNAY